MNNRAVPMGEKGKAASSLQVGPKAEHFEHIPALSADGRSERGLGVWEQFTVSSAAKMLFMSICLYGKQAPVSIQKLPILR